MLEWMDGRVRVDGDVDSRLRASRRNGHLYVFTTTPTNKSDGITSDQQ